MQTRAVFLAIPAAVLYALNAPLSKLLRCDIPPMMTAALLYPGAPPSLSEIAFSTQSGFYDRPLMLKISTDIKGAAIYYTTDGSLPDAASLHYQGALHPEDSNRREDVMSHKTGILPGEPYIPTQDFPTGHIIRAVAIAPNGEKSEVISGTFFVGYDRKALYGEKM